MLERSHLVVQIVDARNPLRFRCEDLEEYIQDIEGAEGEAGIGAGRRKSMLLINKADLLNSQQRCVRCLRPTTKCLTCKLAGLIGQISLMNEEFNTHSIQPQMLLQSSRQGVILRNAIIINNLERCKNMRMPLI